VTTLPPVPDDCSPRSTPPSGDLASSTSGVSSAGTGGGLSLDDIVALRKLALGDLYFFAKGVLGFDRLTDKVHKPLCRLLELYGPYDQLHLVQPWHHYAAAIRLALKKMRVPRDQWDDRIAKYRREGIKKLMIKMPRAWYKTTLGSIAYPVWRGARDCNHRCLLTQNTMTNAVAKGSAVGQCWTGNPLMGALFPEMLPTGRDKWSSDGRCLHRTKNFAEATYEYAGTRTQKTSTHFNEILEDDTVAPDKDDLGADAILPSPDDVSQAIGWHRLVPPLLDDLSTGRNIIFGTRWFVLDLLKWVEEHEPDFLIFQWAVKEDAQGQPSATGEVVWPERFSQEVLDALSASLGPYLFSCLYMNTPLSSESMLFAPEMVQFYDREPRSLAVFTTVDLGGDPRDAKKGRDPDPSVVMTCGKDLTDGHCYVLDYDCKRCSVSEVIDLIFAHVKKWHPLKVGIETFGWQSTMMSFVRDRQIQTNTFFVTEKIQNNKISKERKIQGLQPIVADKRLHLRAAMTSLYNQMMTINKHGKAMGANDDMVDALAMQLSLWLTVKSIKEEAYEATKGGPLDFDRVVAECRHAQESVDKTRSATEGAPRPAWGKIGRAHV
jgi:hypothetical protein